MNALNRCFFCIAVIVLLIDQQSIYTHWGTLFVYNLAFINSGNVAFLILLYYLMLGTLLLLFSLRKLTLRS